MMRLAAVLALLPAMVPALAAAQPALGQARILNDNRAQARERALDDALRQTVERAIDAALGPEVRARSPLAVRVVSGHARALTERYRVVQESESGGIYQVELEATVDGQRLARELERAGLVRPGGAAAPTVAVALRASDPPVAAALRRALAEAGVTVSQVPPVRATLTAVARTLDEGEVRGAGVVAARVDSAAELGEAGADPGAKVALGASGRSFAADAARARAAALAAAATELGRAVARRLAAPAGGVSVRIGGRFGYVGLQALATALASLPGVTAVEPRRFGHGLALLLLRTTFSAAEIEARLTRLSLPGQRHTVGRGPAGELRVRLEPAIAGEGPEGKPW